MLRIPVIQIDLRSCQLRLCPKLRECLMHAVAALLGYPEVAPKNT
jgi:hypothetical protein